jgi:molybdenum cofactor cytidylyltransferase
VSAKVAGLILAAGASTRMGRPKQLLGARGGRSLLHRIMDESLSSDLDLVALVLGSHYEEIKETIVVEKTHPKLRIIENKDFKEGISSSIRAGLSIIQDHYDHVMILLGDMPYITTRIINLLLHRYLESPMPLGALKTGKRRSHPVIIGRTFYPEIHRLTGDTGARDLFSRFSDQVLLVDAGEDYEDVDIDTPEDYEQYQRMTGDK